MGTRGLLGFIIRGKRHAAYNHWDSYPSGLGSQIVAFLLSLSPPDYALMLARLEEITWVDEKTIPSQELQDQYSALGYSNTGVGNQALSDWYCLLHKLQGAAALPAIKEGKVKHLAESIEFLEDGLFCEWTYFIDFEAQTLETWKEAKRYDVRSFTELDSGYMDGLQERYQREENGEEEEDDEEEA
ncbi:hypothetical protein LSUE1_G008810 [Lachnellula suecica]|uniref:Uncharacterized protein n=1 Tax=Lachnellula suecica TaxID=602035 RepID=A0A8T9BT53_9HELO|nr:hypothetical protein LSUE1_G008810 [Lachnellula suecica]